MKFTYKAYAELLHLLRDSGYSVKGYHEDVYDTPCVILRHDIDFSIDKALNIAEIEYKEGVSSTFFVLLSSDLYNPATRKSRAYLKELTSLGHEIGLHFDERAYYNADKEIITLIQQEASVLSEICGKKIKAVSMHRPSCKTLAANYEISGIVNSYGKLYFGKFKYLSDSRMCWKEPVEDIIKSKQYDKIHILTHCFWYEEEERSMRDKIMSFINASKIERYDFFNENFSNLQNVVERREIE